MYEHEALTTHLGAGLYIKRLLKFQVFGSIVGHGGTVSVKCLEG